MWRSLVRPNYSDHGSHDHTWSAPARGAITRRTRITPPRQTSARGTLIVKLATTALLALLSVIAAFAS